jgi:hypothetical protein
MKIEFVLNKYYSSSSIMGHRSSCVVELETSQLPIKTEINDEKCIFKDCEAPATSTIWINVNHSQGYNHSKQVGLILCKTHSNITSFNAACECTHSITGVPVHLVEKPLSKKYEYIIIYKALMSEPSTVVPRDEYKLFFHY